MHLNSAGCKKYGISPTHVLTSLTKDLKSQETEFQRLSLNHLSDLWWARRGKENITPPQLSDWGQLLPPTRATQNLGLLRGKTDWLMEGPKNDKFHYTAVSHGLSWSNTSMLILGKCSFFFFLSWSINQKTQCSNAMKNSYAGVHFCHYHEQLAIQAARQLMKTVLSFTYSIRWAFLLALSCRQHRRFEPAVQCNFACLYVPTKNQNTTWWLFT